ncbi:hypothetical protein HQ563_06070, partial [bacterium]|nr:hypothetical protein [bacterium]
MCVSKTKSLVAVLLLIGAVAWTLSAQAGTSVIDPASITQVNPSGYDAAFHYDDCRTNADAYWDDRGELIGSQGNFTDAVTGKTMVGLEGIQLSNDAKGSEGNAAGEDYELNFDIRSDIDFQARVYVLIGIRHVFSETPEAAVKAAFDDNAYSPQMDATNVHTDRTWIGLDKDGEPIASAPVFNKVLERPDGMPMVFMARNGVGEEYFAFYHDFDAGDPVGIYGGYSGGSNYFVFAEPVPSPDEPTTDNLPDIWTSVDIGSTKPGAAHFDSTNSEWIISADGGDIWGSADAFRYVYTDVTGDFTVQARYNWLLNVGNDWGKIGLMVRYSTDAGSPHATLSGRALNDYIGIQARSDPGGGSAELVTQWNGPVMPKWFRFQRVGDTLTAYTSDNAIDWGEFGSLPAPGDVLVGMAVTSHIDGTLTTASFNNTYITGKDLVFVHPGFDQSVDQGAADSTFVLDGSGSLEADTYLWEQISPGAPLVTITDPSQATITLDGKDVDIFGDTTFVFRLTVTNSTTGASQSSTIQVSITDKEQANAGPDQEVGEGEQVFLDGTGTTGVITKWEWEQIGGPAVPALFSANTDTPHFFTDDYAGDQLLQFKLTINDGEGVDFVDVVVRDAEHVIADAGADIEAYEMRTIWLDARGSDTRDGAGADALTYAWVQTGGPAAFGDYVAPGTGALIPGEYWFVAPEILSAEQDRRNWPPTRTLTYAVTVTGPNGSTAQDSVTVTIKDAEFETVFYREAEDFDFHNSLVGGKWYPEEAEFGVHYCWGAVANEGSGMVGRLDPEIDYQWVGWGGWHDYRDGSSLGDSAQVRDTSGTDWKCGWINTGAGEFWKYTLDLPTGSD